MSFTQTAIGGGLVFGAVTLLVQSFDVPSYPYMQVYDMEVTGETVTVDRRIERELIADWRVTVVKDKVDGPSCATRPGPEEHEGWSRYVPSERSSRTMSMDIWVGDEGCWERLIPGNYVMHVTWTPRDGSEPVTAREAFTKGGA